MTISLSAATTQAQDTADALKTIEAGKADGSLWQLADDARDRLYHQAHPGPQVRGGVTVKSVTSTPAPAKASEPPAPWPPTRAEADKMDPWTGQAQAEAELERRRQALGDKNRPLLTIGDDGRVRDAPDPDAQSPVSVADADLPPITLPEGVSPDDPVVHAARTLAFYGEVPAPTLQRAADAIRGALEGDEPSQEQLDAEGDRVTALGQAYYKEKFPQWLANLEQGKMIAEGDPELRDLLENPRLWNLPAVAEFLAALGRNPRKYYTRKVGTKPRFTVR